jgi:hypothetical protein
MTKQEFHHHSKKGTDILIANAQEAIEKVGEADAFSAIADSIYLTSVLCANGDKIMAGVQAECLIRLAKLATPASLPATTLAE